ncbi:MAG TPA: MFS transporter, partial [Ktedonobacteraceae bacterium]|nr:MFS transporter [Ktedonobacteraceae bacterium]
MSTLLFRGQGWQGNPLQMETQEAALVEMLNLFPASYPEQLLPPNMAVHCYLTWSQENRRKFCSSHPWSKLMHLFFRLPPDSLWRNSHFVLFWSGRSISLLGTIITQTLLPILVFRLTNSAFQTSLLATFEVLPYLFFGLFAGALADRVNRKRLMIFCDLTNVLLLGSIPLAAILHRLTLGQIYMVGLLSALAFVWFDAANFGALPLLVGRQQIVNANSTLSASESLLSIGGPALAGLLAALLTPELAISVDACSYACSALSLLLIPRALSTLRSPDDGEHLRLI